MTAAQNEAPGLSNEEVLRYSRYLIMPEVGMEGQQKAESCARSVHWHGRG